jgi:hypothetical protein
LLLNLAAKITIKAKVVTNPENNTVIILVCIFFLMQNKSPCIIKKLRQFYIKMNCIFYFVNTDKSIYRTSNVNPIIAENNRLSKVCSQLETKNPSQFVKDSEMVEDNGVEPMTSCMPCKRSSQLS